MRKFWTKTSESLTNAIRETHRRYTIMINRREKWTGYLWQGRYSSYPMDDKHLSSCVKYIEQNPVKAGLVEKAGEWNWSSAKHHLGIKEDEILGKSPLVETISNWQAYLEGEVMETTQIKLHETTGRPFGSLNFIESCEKILNRVLKLQQPGRKSKKHVPKER